MENLTVEHDQLNQNIISDGDFRRHHLIARVARWQSRSIQEIQRIADKVRQRLKKTLDSLKESMENSLRPVTYELQEHPQTGVFTEIDLKKWMNQWKVLRKQMEKPSI